jgi:hypothetical protein
MRLLKVTDTVTNTIKFFHGMFRIISRNYQGRHFSLIAQRAARQENADVPAWQMSIVRRLGNEDQQVERMLQEGSLKANIKSGIAKFCSFLVIPIIATLYPIALALDAVDFAIQAVVEICSAAVVIFRTITSPMPTKTSETLGKTINAPAVENPVVAKTYEFGTSHRGYLPKFTGAEDTQKTIVPELEIQTSKVSARSTPNSRW